MKKIILMALVLSWVSLPLFAEEVRKDDESMPSMEKGMMGGKGMYWKHMIMGKASMVSTDKGGVIVLAGNKLMKYDADLSLVKEVEIKMPMMDGKQCLMKGKAEKEREKKTA